MENIKGIKVKIYFSLQGEIELDEVNKIMCCAPDEFLSRNDILLNNRVRGFDLWAITHWARAERELDTILTNFRTKLAFIDDHIIRSLAHLGISPTIVCVLWFDEYHCPIIHLGTENLAWINAIQAELVIDLYPS